MRCGSTGFKLMSDGYVGCFQCNKRYSYVSAFEAWVPHAMSAEEYLIKVLGKQWDPKEKKYVDPKNDDDKQPPEKTK